MELGRRSGLWKIRKGTYTSQPATLLRSATRHQYIPKNKSQQLDFDESDTGALPGVVKGGVLNDKAITLPKPAHFTHRETSQSFWNRLVHPGF